MAEPLNLHREDEPFGPPEMLAIPVDREGTVQLAEQYAQDGTVIEWERHNFTKTDDPDVEARRLAIVTDASGNTHFLTGDVLYNMAESARDGAPRGEMYDDTHKVPDVTIGRSAAFTNGNAVVSVLIATERLDSRDPVNTNQLAGARRQRENPFLRASQGIQHLVDDPQVAREAEWEWPKTADGMELFGKYAMVPDPHKAGAVWTAEEQKNYEEGKIDYPLYKLSRFGHPISPRTIAKRPDWYQARWEEVVKHRIGESIMAGADVVVSKTPVLRGRADRKARKQQERTEEFWKNKPVEQRPPEYRHL